MKTESNIQIAIEYKLNNSIHWQSVELTPSEYFDLEPDEKIELDCIPKYNHAIEYLNLQSERIVATKLILIDPTAESKRFIVERFWNGGENRLIERTDIGANTYWELILEHQISKDPLLWEIVRLGRENGIVTPWYHGFLQDNDDGSQTETKVDTEGNLT
jgi:hypothetical protein